MANAARRAVRGRNAVANTQRRQNFLLDPEFWAYDIPRRAGQAAQGLTSGLLGAPVDLASMVMRPFGYNVPPEQTVGSTEWFGTKLGADVNSAPFIAGSFGPAPDAMDAMRAAAQIDPRMIGGALGAMTAWHGSPHRFDKFDISKIGTGEGAQAYGHGLYFAENPGVAKSYRFVNARIDPEDVTYQGRKVEDWYNQAQRAQDRAHRLRDNEAIAKANAELGFWENLMTRNHPDQVIQDALADPDDWPERYEFVRGLDRSKFSGVEEAGNIYEVDIPDEAIDRMLDWDKPLSEQPESVRKVLDQIGDDKIALAVNRNIPLKNFDRSRYSGEDLYRGLSREYGGTGSDVNASNRLKELGIPGIRYLDAGSRPIAGTAQRQLASAKRDLQAAIDANMSEAAIRNRRNVVEALERDASEGTRNFVVFDDSIVKIIDRK